MQSLSLLPFFLVVDDDGGVIIDAEEEGDDEDLPEQRLTSEVARMILLREL